MRQVPVFFINNIKEEDIYYRSHTEKFLVGVGIYDFLNDIGGLWFDIVIYAGDIVYDGVRLVLRKITKIFGVLVRCGMVKNVGKIKELENGDISRKASFDRMFGIFGRIWYNVGNVWRVIFGKRSKIFMLPHGESRLDGYWIGIDPAVEGKDRTVVFKINDIREGL